MSFSVSVQTHLVQIENEYKDKLQNESSAKEGLEKVFYFYCLTCTFFLV